MIFKSFEGEREITWQLHATAIISYNKNLNLTR